MSIILFPRFDHTDVFFFKEKSCLAVCFGSVQDCIFSHGASLFYLKCPLYYPNTLDL